MMGITAGQSVTTKINLTGDYKVATFSSWLTRQSNRDDDVGALARKWAAAAASGDRPKVHTPSGIGRWLQNLPEQGDTPKFAGWISQATQEYNLSRIGDDPGQGDPALRGVITRTDERLAAIERYLLALLADRGIHADAGTPGGPETPLAAPEAPWQRLYGLADFTPEPDGEAAAQVPSAAQGDDDEGKRS
jgi:hypothetical protein